MGKDINKFSKTEESIFTLFTLGVLAIQCLEAITKDERLAGDELEFENDAFHEIINGTTREALVYQLLLRTCSFMDEWNGFFGVKTDECEREKIRTIKRVAKGTIQNITSWKELKEFRNHFIAHNHRNAQGKNVYLNIHQYHAPQSDPDLYIIVFSIKKVLRLLRYFYPHVLEKTLKFLRKPPNVKSTFMTKKEFRDRKKVAMQIDDFIFSCTYAE